MHYDIMTPFLCCYTHGAAGPYLWAVRLQPQRNMALDLLHEGIPSHVLQLGHGVEDQGNVMGQHGGHKLSGAIEDLAGVGRRGSMVLKCGDGLRCGEGIAFGRLKLLRKSINYA